jgi:hypothetical protein
MRVRRDLVATLQWRASGVRVRRELAPACPTFRGLHRELAAGW